MLILFCLMSFASVRGRRGGGRGGGKLSRFFVIGVKKKEKKSSFSPTAATRVEEGNPLTSSPTSS